MFDLDVSALEIVARTALVYIALLAALRIAGKRELGQMTPFDLVVVLLISEAAQNAMIGGDSSVTGGLIAVGVLMGGNYAVAAATDRVPRLRELLESEPTVLVRDGRLLNDAMLAEGLNEEEIMTAVRAHGLEELESVRLAVLEPDGSISVIARDQKSKRRSRRGAFGRRR
jgi:uncharacterized membrane protein YcaP (DUF421 family)